MKGLWRYREYVKKNKKQKPPKTGEEIKRWKTMKKGLAF
jgi:hypothetical protein